MPQDDPHPRRRGRPPVDPTDVRSARFALRMTGRAFDALYAAARQRRVTMAEVARQFLGEFLDDDRKR